MTIKTTFRHVIIVLDMIVSVESNEATFRFVLR